MGKSRKNTEKTAECPDICKMIKLSVRSDRTESSFLFGLDNFRMGGCDSLLLRLSDRFCKRCDHFGILSCAGDAHRSIFILQRIGQFTYAVVQRVQKCDPLGTGGSPFWLASAMTRTRSRQCPKTDVKSSNPSISDVVMFFVSNATVSKDANRSFTASSSTAISLFFLPVTSRIEADSKFASRINGVRQRSVCFFCAWTRGRQIAASSTSAVMTVPLMMRFLLLFMLLSPLFSMQNCCSLSISGSYHRAEGAFPHDIFRSSSISLHPPRRASRR